MTERKAPLSLLVTVKGIAIGLANIIPGVSGGTIAVIVGIYDELMEAFGAFFSSEGGWKRNLLFLLPLIFGVLIGNVAFARLIGFFLAEIPAQTNFFFIGLIVGSTPYLINKAGQGQFRWYFLIAFALGLGLVLWMGLAERPAASPPLTEITFPALGLMLAVSVIASFAMVVPGVSGSFLLLLFGMYSTMQHSFSTLNIPFIAVFVGGHIIGVVLVARLITYLLGRFHGFTYFVILGLVLGSVVSLWEGFTMDITGLTGGLALVAGFLLSFFLGTGTKDRLKSAPEDKR